MRAASDVEVCLPMSGRASSLNVSAAAAALLYEIVRQRRTGESEGMLS
jgi:tRNA G18 (ribose-2'-O)-methylase SpoU